MTRILTGALFVLTAFSTQGCHLLLADFEYRDAGPDAAVVDGGSDAGVDVVGDAGSDDAGTDAGEDAGNDGGLPPAPLDPLRRLATGWVHTCVISEGAVYCWGDNEHGQLGTGVEDSLVPVRVAGLPAIVEVSATGYFTCALAGDGRVFCWGQNAFGELGDETMEMRRAPVRAAAAIDDAVRIAAGGESVCALREGGGVSCWGRGVGGTLGNGALADSLVPVDVLGLVQVLGVNGSGGHYCAREEDGSVSCWGWNDSGRLGQVYDPVSPFVSVPVSPRGIAGARQVSAGGRHSCARTDTAVACWGWNMFGQLGNGSGPDSHTPVVVAGLDSVAADITGGGSHTCALLESGAVYCWGGNAMGQLGLGDRMERAAPIQVSGFTAAVEQVSAGDFHACALLSTGDVACWGGNFEGQLGTGVLEDSLTPQIVDVSGT